MRPRTKESECFIVSVGGSRGVGKTTVLKYLASTISDLKVVSMSEDLGNFCLETFKTNFFEATVEQKDRYRQLHGERLIARLGSERRNYLFDLHYTDITEGDNKIIQPEIILKHIGVFAFLDADTKVIIERMDGEETRGRVKTISHIEKERRSEMAAAKKLAEIYNKQYLYLNTEGLIKDVAIGLYGLLRFR